MNREELDRLIHQYYEQTLPPQEEERLFDILRADPASADRFVELTELESAMVETLRAEEAAPPEVVASTRGSRRRIRVATLPDRRPVWPLFLAASLMLGFIAIVLQSAGKTEKAPVAIRTERPVEVTFPETPVVAPEAPLPPRRIDEPRRVEPSAPSPSNTPKPEIVEAPKTPEVPQPKPIETPAPVIVERPAPPTEAGVAEAKVEKVEGVVVRLADAAETPAASGQTLPSGQGLEVRKGSVIVALADGTRVELRPETRLDRILLSAEQKRFVLSRGSASSTVAKQPAKTSVVFQTPHAEVTVIGTRLTVEIGADSTRVDVQEGRVRCQRTSDRAAVEISAGRYAVAGKGPAPVTRPVPVVRSFQDGVAPTPEYSGTRDTWISSAEPTRNFATGNLLRLTKTSDSLFALLRWDVSSIPPGSRIVSAELSFWVTGKLVGGSKLYSMVRPWDENEATWRMATSTLKWGVSGATSDGDRSARLIGVLAPEKMGMQTLSLNEFGVAAVQEWVNAKEKNCGILVVGPDVNEWNLDSRESAVPERRPKLTVTFIPGK